MRYKMRLISDRDLSNKKSKSQTSLYSLMLLLIEQDQHKQRMFLSPIPLEDGRYVTNELSLDKSSDIRIFRETQLKRLLRMLTTTPPLINRFFNWLFVTQMNMKLDYFADNEEFEPETLYKHGPEHQIEAAVDNQFKIHNLGHATQLIQTEGMNILTDPVFGDLSTIAYPSTTKYFKKDIPIEQLPKIDVILISHNHRDHVDEPSLRAIMEQNHNPHIFVPLGDGAYFTSLGFKKVHEFEWHQEIILTSDTDQSVTICCVPADHCSRRHGFDGHRSLVSGWLISPESRNEILYFAGDTASLDNTRLLSLALDIYALYRDKAEANQERPPQIINMCPGGPNYTRQDMKVTHQSAVESISVSFRLALALEVVSAKEGQALPAQDWLHHMATVFMHHNKFELGPDRFNENVFIFNRMLSYLEMDDETLAKHLQKQQSKNASWSLFHRRKDFIIEGVMELRELALSIWPQYDLERVNQKIIDFIKARTHFPLLMEKITSDDAFKFADGEESTIKPKTLRGTKFPEAAVMEEVDNIDESYEFGHPEDCRY